LLERCAAVKGYCFGAKTNFRSKRAARATAAAIPQTIPINPQSQVAIPVISKVPESGL